MENALKEPMAYALLAFVLVSVAQAKQIVDQAHALSRPFGMSATEPSLSSSGRITTQNEDLIKRLEDRKQKNADAVASYMAQLQESGVREAQSISQRAFAQVEEAEKKARSLKLASQIQSAKQWEMKQAKLNNGSRFSPLTNQADSSDVSLARAPASVNVVKAASARQVPGVALK